MKTKNTLDIIQIIAKIGKILSKIVFVCSIIGAVGCIIGIVSLAFAIPDNIRIGGVTIHSLIEKEAGMNIGTLYGSVIVGLILCVGEIILASLLNKYFVNELKAGTPFTYEGADEMKKVGLFLIIIPVVCTVLSHISYAILGIFYKNMAELNLGDYVSIGLGIIFLILSLICRYGSEIAAQNEKQKND
ncbi:MAG: hypothetical protein PUB34_05275 [Clostridia bacterium]|nr:hypothetical protein [Clostridia bacterium]